MRDCSYQSINCLFFFFFALLVSRLQDGTSITPQDASSGVENRVRADQERIQKALDCQAFILSPFDNGMITLFSFVFCVFFSLSLSLANPIYATSTSPAEKTKKEKREK